MSSEIAEVRTLMKEIGVLNKETAAINKETAAYIKETQKLQKETNYVLNGYIKNEATAIEVEVNKKVANFLKRKFLNYNIFSKEHWKTLQKNKIVDVNNKLRDKNSITEFDGLFVVSNDPDYFSDNWLHRMSSANTKKNNNKKQTHFIVVESKHALDAEKVNRKIAQMIEFQKYIVESANPDPKIHTKEYRNKIVSHYLPEFIGMDLYLIFASPYLSDSCKDYIKNNALFWLEKHKIHVAYMKPSGNRYSIAWIDDNFVEKTNVNTTGLVVTGGDYQTRRSKMKKT